jgi:type II secretion system protein I
MGSRRSGIQAFRRSGVWGRSPERLSTRTPERGRPGFTLIEVLVAVAVLAIGISAGVRAIGAMAQSSAAAEDRETAVRLAAERLAVLEAGVEGTAGNAEGNFETEPRFRWQQSVAASSEQPGVLEATVTITWLDGAVERHYPVTTYLVDTPTETTTTETGGQQ